MVFVVVQVKQKGNKVGVNLVEKLFFGSAGSERSEIAKQRKCGCADIRVFLSVK